MVNYHDPATIASESEGVVKLWHLVDGIYIWEFVSNLDYEWDVIRGHRPHKWTIWIYSASRWTTLMAVILNIVGFDTTTKINCQVWITFMTFFAYLAFITASLLIALRVIAIWNKSKIVIAIAMGIWLTDISLFITGLIRMRATWSPEANSCILVNFDSTLPTIIVSFVSDIGLLLIMLIGLLRLRLKTGGAFVLGRFLWKQGLIWILIATASEAPSLVLALLNLNVPLNLITQVPSTIIATIAATRVYRSLSDFSSPNISSSLKSPPGAGRSVSEVRVRTGPIPLNRVEVSVRTECDQFPMSQMSHSGSYIDADTQENYKAHEVSLNVDVESGPEEK
ncbi:hypothetical protein DFH94DRAFT_27877 [Russula ochroleuca]|uniref:Uncharacterized protein n=1 Tax=Russula ochroleuca TaxID=152965 RepID=A0A9P5N6G2_9AGAM|nr:hypothetical protein DFH94DRAFT_27877 [Russula ochroleuca]